MANLYPASPNSPLEKAPVLQSRGSLAAVFVVLMGVGVSIFEADDPDWPFVLSALAIATIYITLFLKVGDHLSATGSPFTLAAYFIVQTALVAGLSALLAHQGTFGVSWISFMPLISQSRIVLRPWGTASVCITCLAVMAAHVYVLGGWHNVPSVLAGVSTAIVFVLLFTDIAMREAAARAESQGLSDKLAEANQKLSDYAVQAEELATVRERGRVAREIHDSLGHVLSALNMQIEAARAMFNRDSQTSLDALDKAQGLARDGLSEIRRSVATLTTSPLDGQSLDDALAHLVDQNAASGIPTRLRIEGESRPLGSRADLTLYRVVQEGLTNARKHSQASHVDVVLDYRSPQTLRLEIRDDGVGDNDPRDGFGLLGVRERIRQVDGDLKIETRRGHGLSLEVEIPA